MIVIGSASKDRLSNHSSVLSAISRVAAAADYAALLATFLRAQPHIAVVDFDLPQLNGVQGIRALHAASPETCIIVLSPPQGDQTELALFRSGRVRGCCPYTVDEQTLQRAVVAVLRGELWIRRALVARLLDDARPDTVEQGRQREEAAAILAELTRREREIAALVSSGNCNKEIARRLDITERTVKAHLTEIFRKLGISNRLSLALRVTGPGESSPTDVV